MVIILSQPLNGVFKCPHFTKGNSHVIIYKANKTN